MRGTNEIPSKDGKKLIRFIKQLIKSFEQNNSLLNKYNTLKNKLEKKFEVLQEDCQFYERQFDNRHARGIYY